MYGLTSVPWAGVICFCVELYVYDQSEEQACIFIIPAVILSVIFRMLPKGYGYIWILSRM